MTYRGRVPRAQSRSRDNHLGVPCAGWVGAGGSAVCVGDVANGQAVHGPTGELPLGTNPSKFPHLSGSRVGISGSLEKTPHGRFQHAGQATKQKLRACMACTWLSTDASAGILQGPPRHTVVHAIWPMLTLRFLSSFT